MLWKDVQSIIGTDRDVAGDGWRSRRLILAAEGLPFSVHETTLDRDRTFRFKYAAHSETVYCIEGEGSVENASTGESFALAPGRIYSVSIGDDHVVRSRSEMKLLCIFHPPLEGTEEAD